MKIIQFLSVIVFFLPFVASAQPFSFDDDESVLAETPYFIVNGAEEADHLPLLSNSAAVKIVGTLADVTVTQKFKNDGIKPIEAIYIFPAATTSAVYSVTMTIGNRVVKAKIKEKEQAKREYERAKTEGKSASLLEQQRANVFKMSVANILPGDLIEVELKYTELLKREDGIFEFVYPMSIGNRYIGSDNSSTLETSNSELEQPPSVTNGDPFESTIQLDIVSNTSVYDINSPSHDINQSIVAYDRVRIELGDNDSVANRDFVLRYKVGEDTIKSSVLLESSEEENFFLIQLDAPKRIEASYIPPREYIFVVDVSGSMSGFPLSVSKSLVTNLLSSLSEEERFNILFFAGSSSVLSKTSLQATEKNISAAKKMLSRVDSRGGTELLPAIKNVQKNAVPDGYSRSVVVVTDGYVSVEAETYKLISENLNQASYFSLGIGNSVNRELVETIAKAGFGESYIALNKKEGLALGEKLIDLIRNPVLTDIDIEFIGFDAGELQPEFIPDLYAQKPLLISGKWRGDAIGQIRISGKTGAGNWSKDLNLADATVLNDSESLKYVWARRKLSTLNDYYSLDRDDDTKASIIETSLQYNLLSQFTSFLAIDEIVRTYEESKPVTQPQASSYSSSQTMSSELDSIDIALLSKTPNIAEPHSSLTISDVEFELVGDAWVDVRHNASVEVLEVNRDSEQYLKLLQEFSWLSALPVSRDCFVRFGKYTIRITSSTTKTLPFDSLLRMLSQK